MPLSWRSDHSQLGQKRFWDPGSTSRYLHFLFLPLPLTSQKTFQRIQSRENQLLFPYWPDCESICWGQSKSLLPGAFDLFVTASLCWLTRPLLGSQLQSGCWAPCILQWGLHDELGSLGFRSQWFKGQTSCIFDWSTFYFAQSEWYNRSQLN